MDEQRSPENGPSRDSSLGRAARTHHQSAARRPGAGAQGPRQEGGHLVLISDRDRERQQAPVEHGAASHRRSARRPTARTHRRRRGSRGDHGQYRRRTDRPHAHPAAGVRPHRRNCRHPGRTSAASIRPHPRPAAPAHSRAGPRRLRRPRHPLSGRASGTSPAIESSAAERTSGDAILELTDLFRTLGPDDQQRVLDLVRRLAD